MNYRKTTRIPHKHWSRLKMTDVVYVEQKNKGVLVMFVGMLADMDKEWLDKGKKKYKIYNIEVTPALMDVQEEQWEKKRRKEDKRYEWAEDIWCADYNENKLTTGEKMILAEIGEGPYASVED